MRILIDCKDRLAEFVPAGADWEETPVETLAEPERGLWRALAEGPVAWTAQPTVATRRASWRRMIIIGHAARSQFDALHDALGRGIVLDGPTAVLALGGDQFHGQRGRPWSAIAGNLFLTVGLPVGAPAADLVPALIMLPTVAVVDAIRACGGATPTIKWVNDVFVDGRKVAGVLAASVCRDDLLEAAVLGLGVNVAHAPAIEPSPFVPAAGCLTDAGIEVTLADFTWSVLDCLAERYRALLEKGPATLLDSYRAASCIVGRRVRVWDESTDRIGAPEAWPPPIAAGIVSSIGPDLSLMIAGRREPVSRGRLALEEVCVALGL
jgi:biotin-(acetyl-CoA carboxylase) ligase